MSLIQLMLWAFVAVLLLTGGGLVTDNANKSTNRDAIQQLGALMTAARAQAATSEDGATVALTPRAGGGSMLLIYDGRPSVGSAQGRQVGRAVLASTVSIDGVDTIGIFIDHSGRAVVRDGWTTWTTLAAQPADCTDIAIATRVGALAAVGRVAGTLSCLDGRTRIN